MIDIFLKYGATTKPTGETEGFLSGIYFCPDMKYKVACIDKHVDVRHSLSGERSEPHESNRTRNSDSDGGS